MSVTPFSFGFQGIDTPSLLVKLQRSWVSLFSDKGLFLPKLAISDNSMILMVFVTSSALAPYPWVNKANFLLKPYFLKKFRVNSP